MKPIIFFDYDGVLVDSYDVVYKINEIYHPDSTKEQFLDYYNVNVFDRLKERIGEENVEERVSGFVEKYHTALMGESIIPGMADVVSDLAVDNTLVVMTSSHSKCVKDHLKQHSLYSAFDKIMGADIHHSKTKKMRDACEIYGQDSGNTIMITDTTGDIMEADAAGISSIGVSWGFHGNERLEKVSSYGIVHSPDELEKKIREYFSN